GVSGAKSYFFQDMLELFRQFTGRNKLHLPSKETVKKWMERYPSGLDPHIIKFREENRERIINIIIDKIEKGEINKPKYSYLKKMTREQKFLAILDLWNDKSFHIHFAIRSPEQLNEFLGGSLNREKMKILMSAKKAGLPFFVNLYYLSLLNVRIVPSSIGADLAVRDYIIYNRQLIKEFGRIVAWEKEDKVQPGKPNAAGWILPLQYNIHRRYPEVAIMIPDTMGRACGGLCTSCQRMFDFQKGVLNFDLEKLKPKKPWDKKLKIIMDYFVNDSQIRDVLITGGDALMSSDESLKNILENVFDMALSKKERNEQRKNGEKYAEIIRVRLGTRLLAYLPQRITPKLIKILTDFKFNAQKIGIKQFIIQAHFESPIEVTPEAREAVSKLISSGWMVTNQLVFTTSASRRGHTAKLRQVLNEIGVITYYSFSVKGFKENNYNFATIARSVQEQIEEKSIGKIPESKYNSLKQFSLKPTEIVENIKHLKNEAKIPFLSTDRNVLNLPGVGKSLTFRVIGITRYGRRILEFDHDPTRSHSPIIKKMGKVIIVESKSISEYLKQLDAMGEDISEYKDVYGYSLGVTEPRMQIFDYPEYNFKITDKITNLKID
ncbi:MAG: KamA family protein, partial [Chitinispirillia bacterium]